MVISTLIIRIYVYVQGGRELELDAKHTKPLNIYNKQLINTLHHYNKFAYNVPILSSRRS